MKSLLAETPSIILSTSSYVLLHTFLPYLLSRSTSTLSRRDHLLLSSKLIGATHSILSSSLALRLVLSPEWTTRDLIDTKAEAGDRIVALELGYLVADTVALALTRRKLRDRGLVTRVIGHHLVVGGLMGWYLSAAARGKAKGVFFVASYMIMNLSTPLRYLTWYLKRYTRTSKRVVSGVHATSMAVYASVRLGLLYYQLWVYGRRKGVSAIEAFKTLPLVCRVSTTLLLLGNGVRFNQLSGFAKGMAKR